MFTLTAVPRSLRLREAIVRLMLPHLRVLSERISACNRAAQKAGVTRGSTTCLKAGTFTRLKPQIGNVLGSAEGCCKHGVSTRSKLEVERACLYHKPASLDVRSSKPAQQCALPFQPNIAT